MVSGLRVQGFGFGVYIGFRVAGILRAWARIPKNVTSS